ncbi:MAG TPA: MBL fold metallo-hydrolase [Pyrinomonadaceae bacterium]
MKRSLLILGFVLTIAPYSNAAPKTLDIYFIDVEGGASTLIVTPLGESMLIDSGFPEERDAQRILHIAKDVARLSQIDHYITTHWHRDHVGGITLLAKLFPVKNFYDHGIPSVLSSDIQPQLIDEYRSVSQGKAITLNAGDQIKFLADRSLPHINFRIVAANARVAGEEAGAPQIKPCGADFKPIEEDKTDNANSLGMLLTFGAFRFFDGGDLTWNVENKLVCPKDLIGTVDLFQVNHHGAANSNNPALVRSLKPRVAVIDNGPRKGGEPKTYATLKSVREIEAIYQLHKNLATSWNDNTPSAYIANDDENCQGEFIKVSVNPNGRSYRVEIPSKKIATTYQVR